MLALILFAVVVGYLILALWISSRFGKSGATARAKLVRRHGCLLVLLAAPFLDLPAVLLAAPFICDDLTNKAEAPIDVEDDGIYLNIQITCPAWCTDILWKLNEHSKSGYIEANLDRPVGFMNATTGTLSNRRHLYRLEVISDEEKCRPDNLRASERRNVSEIYELYRYDNNGAIRCIASTPIRGRTAKTAFETRSSVDSFMLFNVHRYSVGLVDQNGNFRPLSHNASIQGTWVMGVWLPALSEYKNIRTCPSPENGYAQLLQ